MAGRSHDDAQHRVGPGERRRRCAATRSSRAGTAPTTSDPCSPRASRTRRSTPCGRPVRLPVDARRGVARHRSRTRTASARRHDPRRRRARDWSRYVLDAPVMMIRVDDDAQRRPALEPHSFERWIADGHELGWPTLDDLAYHLTTLFPPVRPRGWLELRMIDALPEEWWPVAVAVTAALLDDPRRRRCAATATAARCATAGPPPRATRSHDPALRGAARRCFDGRAARARAARGRRRDRARHRGVRRPLRRAGRCPADDLLDDWAGRAPSLPSDVVTKTEIVDALEECASPHARPARLRCPTPSSAQVSELMSPLVLGPRAHRALRGAVARPRARPARRPPTRVRRHLRRVQAPPARAAVARHPRPGGRARVRRDVRERVARRARPRSTSTRGDRCSPTASSTGWSCSTSTSTTRRCSPRSSSWTTSRIPMPTAARRRPPARAAVDLPADVLVAGGTLRDGHRAPSRGPTTTSDRRTRGRRSRRSASTPRRSPTARTLEFVEAGGYDDPAHWTDDGWAWRAEAGLAAPQFWTPGRRRAGSRRRFGRAETVPARRAGAARVLVRGRRVRPLVRHAPADRGGVGEGRAQGAPRRGAPTCGTTAPTRGSRPHAGRRPHPDGVSRVRARTSMLGGVWEWTASDFAAYPGFGRSRTASTPRCSSGPSTRCCAAARGRRTRGACAPRSATGTTRSAGRSSPASAARATPEPTRCAATSPTSVRRSRSRRCCSTRRTRSCTRPSAPAPGARRRPTPTAGASAGTTTGGVDRSRYRTTTPMWDDARLRRRARRRERRVPRRGPAGVARRHARRRAATRRSSPDAWLVLAQRRRRRLPRRRRRRAARARRARPARRARRRRRHRGAVRARPRAPRRRGTHPADALAPSCATSLGRPPAALNLLLTDGAHDRTRTACRQLARSAAWPSIVRRSRSTTSRRLDEVPDALARARLPAPRPRR